MRHLPGALRSLPFRHALYEGTDFASGRVRDTNLNTYTPLRISDVPEFDIAFVDSAGLVSNNPFIPNFKALPYLSASFAL